MSDFIKSDLCLECGGEGYLEHADKDTGLPRFEQCEECERLRKLEEK